MGERSGRSKIGIFGNYFYKIGLLSEKQTVGCADERLLEFSGSVKLSIAQIVKYAVHKEVKKSRNHGLGAFRNKKIFKIVVCER